MIYPIELTPPAKEAYVRIYETAEPYLEAGQMTHPAVTTFNSIENAMDSILATNPCNPDLALAGVCSVVYRVALASVSICYVVNPAKPSVIVLTISPNYPGMRTWLITAIDNGSIDDLLESLEIEKPGSDLNLSSRLLH